MRHLISILMLGLALTAQAETVENPAASPQKKWATPIKREGLSNFFKVSDELYRGAQPTLEGLKELKKMGVKTVVSFRNFHSDQEMAQEAGLDLVRLNMNTWDPEEKKTVKFLEVVTDRDRQPVFVHCQHGADRTGVMCAIYRVAVCGWTKDEAIEEMTKGGFGFHAVWTNLIEFIRKLDLEAVRKKAGLK